MKTNCILPHYSRDAVQSPQPCAWIVDPKDRGRKKIFLNNKIYLENGSEFVIEMFNPLQDSVLTELKINGKLAASTGLILRPGERFYLDCFIDDRKKFIYKTYEIESDSKEAKKAVENNGLIEINFYKEKIKLKPVPKYRYSSKKLFSGDNLSRYTMPSISYLSAGTTYTDTLSMMDFAPQEMKRSLPKMEETGRIEKGNESNQKFESIDMDFENYTLNRVSYQILPESKKPITTIEVKDEIINNFCPNCGHRVINGDKFCRACGHRLV